MDLPDDVGVLTKVGLRICRVLEKSAIFAPFAQMSPPMPKSQLGAEFIKIQAKRSQPPRLECPSRGSYSQLYKSQYYLPIVLIINRLMLNLKYK